MSNEREKLVDFGYQQVPESEKAERVAGVFRSVAKRYDIMNDLMSLGLHRVMKRLTTEFAAVRPGHKVLDLAGGTGDLALQFSPLVGREGRVVLADINESMLSVGRERVLDAGAANVDVALADAEALPFADASFDCLTIAFGLRNVTHKDRALASMLRVLKPGGRLLVLEFSKPRNALLGKAYDAFSTLWPLAGKAVVGDADAYKYLVESIRMHPDQQTLALMMQDAGFSQVTWHNMLDGIAALHFGIKPMTAATGPTAGAQP